MLPLGADLAEFFFFCQGFPELDVEVADELLAEIGPGFRVCFEGLGLG